MGQRRTDLSRLQVIALRPSGVKTACNTMSVWPVPTNSPLAVSSSQTRTVVSLPPLTTRLPSREIAMAATPSVCFSNRRSSLPVAVPDAGRAVVTAGDELLAVGREGQAEDAERVTL